LRLDAIARGVGYFGTMAISETVTVDGWLLATPRTPIDGCALYVDGERIAETAAIAWPEAELPGYLPAGTAVRFAFDAVRAPFAVRDLARLEVAGLAAGQPVTRIGTFVRLDLDALPTPPEHLMLRVTGNSDPVVVKLAGARCAKEFLETLARHRPLETVHRVLDWGCGCARVTMHLLDAFARYPATLVEGCDIDAEAVAWANANVRAGAFAAVHPHPPLPWPDATFDAVVACSVFTHLTRDAQAAWLAEMQRVIAPGGLLLASIFSDAAEFVDDIHDPVLDGVAPEGYYRFTVQSREQAVSEWSRWFDVAEFVEHGLEGVQHLIVLRRRLVDGVVDIGVPSQSHRSESGDFAIALLDTAPLAAAPVGGAFPPGHFYSPIPAWDEVSRDAGRIFDRGRALPGVDLRHDAQVALFEELAKFYPELPYGTREGLRYTFDNANFGHGDAIVLYAMLRHFRPRRVVEIGSGYSSAVIIDTNELFLDGAAECTFIDPAPQLLESLLRPGDPARILGRRVQDVPEETFTALEANDILFVDSSHVLKTGSDVNSILFEILPRLRSGVIVHFHDVFHPFEYPRSWVLDLGLAWNEIHAVHAFLLFNSAFEIVFFNDYLASADEERFRAAMPLCLANPGGSLWLVRR
jgi:SAM-dependent methyltransferase